MTHNEFRTAAATAAVRRKRQERLARDLISHGWKVFAPEDHEKPWRSARPQVLDVPCPTCKSPAGEACQSARAQQRKSGHAARVDKYITALHEHQRIGV
jgi:hypothetical protein